MADSYLIRIDLDAVARNFGETPPATAIDIREWLIWLGIVERAGGWWAVEEIQLVLFGPSEILEQLPLD